MTSFDAVPKGDAAPLSDHARAGMKVRVLLLRTFREDGRTSMDVYADAMRRALEDVAVDRLEIEEFRPSLGLARLLPDWGNARMRVSRYASYPMQVRDLGRGSIVHIVDHGYAHLLPWLDPARTVVTVHDVIPILAGRGLMAGVRGMRRAHLAEWTARFLRFAAHLIADSVSTRNDLERHCGCDSSRISVVHPGADARYRPMGESKKARIRFELGVSGTEKLVLVVGDSFYKNTATSARVVASLRDEGIAVRLLKLGPGSAEWDDAVRELGLHDAIITRSGLPGEAMPDLYNAVDCLLFPSWYEGFGLPPIEAMACGTPVVASNAGSLPEAVGEAGLMAAPNDVEGLTRHVRSVLTDDRRRRDCIARGLEHAARFDWRRTAEQVLRVYELVDSGQ